jgi:hypothetical protein
VDITEALKVALKSKKMTFAEATVYYNAAETYERKFLDAFLAETSSWTNRTFYEIINLQPNVPGIVYPNPSLFYSNLKEKYLKQSCKVNFSLHDCYLSAICQEKFTESVQLARDMEIMYSVKDFSADFHSKRTDLYFGQFLRNFDDVTYSLIFNGFSNKGLDLICFANSITDLNKSFVSGLLVSYFMPNFKYAGYQDTTHCVNSSTKLLKKYHGTFVDIVKHSFLKNSIIEMEQKMEFLSSYDESLRNAFPEDEVEIPVHLSKQIEMISFCSKNIKAKEFATNLDGAYTCDMFNPILTSKGLCFTYNALSMQQIYRETKHTLNWNNAFSHQTSNILQNDGYGPTKGLNFVLNSFDKYLEHSKSLNFLLAISNAYEPHLMIKKRYVIQPGLIYTFKVIANQIVSSEALNIMSPTDRNCLLHNEIGNFNFLKYYTKSTCEYECLAYHAVEECGCAPWYIPFFEDKPYCDVQTHCGFYSESAIETICDLREDCFDNYLNNASTDQCNCPMECEEIDYSVIKSNQPFLLPENFCTDDKFKTQYPFTVYCGICHKIIQYHKIRLVYDHYVSNKPHPDDINSFCHYFISNYTALVKIEIVSKSVMRSVRDKKFSLMSQVSELGKI